MSPDVPPNFQAGSASRRAKRGRSGENGKIPPYLELAAAFVAALATLMRDS